MKKKKYLIYVSIGAILLATIINLINVKPKAEEIYNFSVLNTAGSSYWNAIIQYEDYDISLSNTTVKYNTWYFYMIYEFGADNPNINSIMCSYKFTSDQTYEDNHPQTEECINSTYMFESGFYYFNINSTSELTTTYLDTLSLPIKLNRNIIYEENSIYYHNLEGTLYAEGNLYYVVRYNIEFFYQSLGSNQNDENLSKNMPSFIFLQETISNANETENSYQEGQNDILQNPNEYGLYTAKQLEEEYQRGLNENLTGSQQYDLGYSAGLESNSVAFGTLIGNIFKGVGGLLEIKVFGDITIGMILAIPVVFGVVWIILKLVRG